MMDSALPGAMNTGLSASRNHPFAIVGIGANAGGLAAFEAFFSGMPADVEPGVAFVLVQHLASGHKSILSNLIRRYSRLQVPEVVDGIVVKVNCVYLIPAECDVAILRGVLHLFEPTVPRDYRSPIDYFFESLAADQGPLGIGIVLCGTGSDGATGIRAMKNAGGMAMAQSNATSEFDALPRSAIATGMVDFQLPPVEMPKLLMEFASYTVDELQHVGLGDTPQVEAEWRKIFALLLSHTGHDFSNYKPSTIYRRTERRMALQALDTIDAYLHYLQQTPSEVQALFGDLLIGVTNFFRDPEHFQVLQAECIPALFAAKAAGGAVRVWSAGCSTGEEAYSLAILLVEHMEDLNQSYTLRVFATDIDSRAIAIARAGLYPPSVAKDMSPERLARFFTLDPEGRGFRVNKKIRELMVFSEQDLIKDPPFSKLDLISCRNLLIYLDARLQSKLIPLFHYVLNPGGVLFLGSSEGVGAFADLFNKVDKKANLYLRKQPTYGARRLPLDNIIAPVMAKFGSLSRPPSPVATDPSKLPLRELMEQALLSHIAPASALVNASGEIIYLYGRSCSYLELTEGQPSIPNILTMARASLRSALRKVLHQAVFTKQSSVTVSSQISVNGHCVRVNASAHPVHETAPDRSDAPLYLLMLQDAPISHDHPIQMVGDNGEDDINVVDTQGQIQALKHELLAKGELLKSTHEELESTHEVLESRNQEMLAANEELHSTNEELETSKEELQSSNQELSAVNTELQIRVTDLSNANNDMNNLLAGSGVGTVFVDLELRILRFTPAARTIINLIVSDVGRPLAHIACNLVNYTGVVGDIKAVLASLVPVEREVKTPEGQWFALRIQPYRTLGNVVEGAVVSFVEISNNVRVREALISTQALMEITGELAKVGGWELDLRTNALFWSSETYRIHDLTPQIPPTLEQAIHFYAPDVRSVIRAALQAGIEQGTAWDITLPMTTATGLPIWVRVQGTAVMEQGKAIKLHGAIQDITEYKQLEESLRNANAMLLAQAKT